MDESLDPWCENLASSMYLQYWSGRNEKRDRPLSGSISSHSYKPDPVSCRSKITIIYLGLSSPTGSIGLPSDWGEPPFHSPSLPLMPSVFGRGNYMVSIAGIHGLSTPGVYLAAPVTRNTGGHLLHHFTLTYPKVGGILSVALAGPARSRLRVLPVR